MTPNLLMTLDIEPHTLMWNGQAISLPGSYELVPDNEIKHLHKRVVAVALHERRRVPLYGRVVGKARYGKHSVWLIEDDNGNLVKAQKPEESELLRVTEILKDYVDLSMVPPDVLQAAAERGTLVHDICAGILQGFFPPEIQEEAKGYVDSFLIFKEKYIRDVIAVEAEVVHPQWRYVGHIDFGGYLTMFEAAVVLDWKTPISYSRSWSGQLAGYLEATAKTFPDHKWAHAGTLQLDPKGRVPKMVWVEQPAAAFHAFTCKLTADNYFRNGGRKS